MKNNFMKRILSAFLVITLLCSQVFFLSGISTYAEENTWDISENSDGTVMAVLDANGVLTISSNVQGATMKEYSQSLISPFYSVGSSISEVVIEGTVTNIGAYIFWLLPNLEAVTISAPIEKVGEGAFYYCSSLAELNVPSSVTSVGSYAFNTGSMGLLRLKINSNSCTFGEEVVSNEYSGGTIIGYENAKTLANKYSNWSYVNISDISTEVLDEWDINEDSNSTVKAILYHDGTLKISGSGKMKDFSSPQDVPWYSYLNVINSLVIEYGVTKIGAYSFKNMNITSVEGNGVLTAGEEALSGCKLLTAVNFPKLTEISKKMFSDCMALEAYTIAANVKKIGDLAFEGCTKLSEISIPESVIDIGTEVFSGCNELSEIVLPYSIQNIGSRALQTGSSKLSKVTVYSVDFSMGDAVLSPDYTGIVYGYAESDALILANRSNWTFKEIDGYTIYGYVKNTYGEALSGAKVYLSFAGRLLTASG